MSEVIAYNQSNVRLIYGTINAKLMEALFELQMKEAIHISNHSEAESISREMAIKALDYLDHENYVTWKDGDTIHQVCYVEKQDIDWSMFASIESQQIRINPDPGKPADESEKTKSGTTRGMKE